MKSTSRTCEGSPGLHPHKFRSLVDYAAFSCVCCILYMLRWRGMLTVLFDRCCGNWKRILRFLQTVEQSSDMVETSAGNMHITTGRTCGQVLASQNHAAFVMQSGEVFTCGDNSASCCWHKDTNRPLLRLRLEEAIKGIACKQVYTWGKGYCGALGHGDEIDKTTPELLSRVQSQLAVQVCKKTEDLCSDGSYGCGWMGFGSHGFTDRELSDKI